MRCTVPLAGSWWRHPLIAMQNSVRVSAHVPTLRTGAARRARVATEIVRCSVWAWGGLVGAPRRARSWDCCCDAPPPQHVSRERERGCPCAPFAFPCQLPQERPVSVSPAIAELRKQDGELQGLLPKLGGNVYALGHDMTVHSFASRSGSCTHAYSAE